MNKFSGCTIEILAYDLDKATFDLNGTVNHQNIRSWQRKILIGRWRYTSIASKIDVWCTIIGGTIIC